MGVLTSISRGLEAVSTPLGVLPDMVYAVAAASFLLLLIVYVFVTPSWREKEKAWQSHLCVADVCDLCAADPGSDHSWKEIRRFCGGYGDLHRKLGDGNAGKSGSRYGRFCSTWSFGHDPDERKVSGCEEYGCIVCISTLCGTTPACLKDGSF